ncbi:uncharacterized protein LOC121764398 [Salvia splendens]|uniref:uncharacterized protein LOC121764398 n=1 Tax=Salvia splendens TaxID=180675 RepID=UPI001C27741A|nr:uncharacterized protein LOC121764398 [Salvia splendens]
MLDSFGGTNDGEVTIDLPSDIVVSNFGDPLRIIISTIYLSYMNHEELSNCLHDRAILAPTLEVVDEVNQFMMSLDQSQGRVYLSSDSISNSDLTSNGLAEIHSVEFLNKLKCSGTPNRELLLKVGTPVMLLRNIDHSNGLCNGTRLSYVASIGDGVIGGPNDSEVAIQLPIDIVLSNSGDPLRTIVSNIYPSYMNPEELISCLHGRAILAPTLEIVDEVNQFMISLDQSQGRVYFSSDSISNSDSTSNGLAEIHSVRFLNNLKCSGTPNHELLLKVGTPVMLLMNIDLSNGLCSGTRLIITRLGDYMLEGYCYIKSHKS